MSKPSDLDKQPRPGLRLVVVERGGFEPPKAKPADLQSAPFDRFGTSPSGSRSAGVTRPPAPVTRARGGTATLARKPSLDLFVFFGPASPERRAPRPSCDRPSRPAHRLELAMGLEHVPC